MMIPVWVVVLGVFLVLIVVAEALDADDDEGTR